MADAKITDLAEDTSPAPGDFLVSVDVSDTSMAPTGTDKKVKVSSLANSVSSALGLGTAATHAATDFDASGAAATVNASLASHVANTANPHAVTAAQVGLGSVLNAAQLVAANNLSDLASAPSARTNLGLGSAATRAATGSGAVASVSGTFAAGHIATFADANGTIQDGGPAPAGLAVGAAVGSGTAGCVLYVDATGNLGDSANLKFDPAAQTLTLTGKADGTTIFSIVGGVGNPMTTVWSSGLGGYVVSVNNAGLAFNVNNPYGFSVAQSGSGNPYLGVGLTANASSGTGVGAKYESYVSTTGTAGANAHQFNAHWNSAGSGPNYGLAIQSGGVTQYGFDRYGRPRSGGATPTVAVAAAAGTGATASVVGNDVGGVVTLNTGAGTAAGTLLTLDFANARDAAPMAPLVGAGNAAAAAAQVYADASSATASSVALGCEAVPAASGTLKIIYRIEG